MAPLILQIVNYITLGIKAASLLPQASALAQQVIADGKDLITALFTAKLITIDQQNSLMAWSDDHMAAVLAGEVPPEFKVE